jgi:hypothetical protein
MAQSTRTVLRLNRINGDGTPRQTLIDLVVKDPVSGAELREADGTPAVVIHLRPMSDDERSKIVADGTRLEKDPQGGRGLYELVDQAKVAHEIMRRSIQSWDGLVGSDDRPLVCTDQTKVLLDAFLQAQITRKLFGAEVAEVLAESFRESADVPAVAR